jgi:hypothetical protein
MKSALQELRKQHLEWEELLEPILKGKQKDGPAKDISEDELTPLQRQVTALQQLSRVDDELIKELESSKVASPLVDAAAFSQEPTILLQRLENMDERLTDMESHLRGHNIWSNEELEDSSQFKKLLVALRGMLKSLEPSRAGSYSGPASQAANEVNAELAALNRVDHGCQTDPPPGAVYARTSLMDPNRMLELPGSGPVPAIAVSATAEAETRPRPSSSTFHLPEKQLDHLRNPSVTVKPGKPTNDEIVRVEIFIDWLYCEHLGFLAEGGDRELRASLFSSFVALYGTTERAMNALWTFLGDALKCCAHSLKARLFVKFCGGTTDEKPFHSDDLAVFLYAWAQCVTFARDVDESSDDSIPNTVQEDDARELAVLVFGEDGHSLADGWLAQRLGDSGLEVDMLLNYITAEHHRRAKAYESPLVTALTSPNFCFSAFCDALEECHKLPASSLLAQHTHASDRVLLRTFQQMHEGNPTGQLSVEAALSAIRNSYLLTQTRAVSAQVREAAYGLCAGRLVRAEWLRINEDDALMNQIEEMRTTHSAKAIAQMRNACEVVADAVSANASVDAGEALKAFRQMSEMFLELSSQVKK